MQYPVYVIVKALPWLLHNSGVAIYTNSVTPTLVRSSVQPGGGQPLCRPPGIMAFFKSVVVLSLVVANLCGGEDGGRSCQHEIVKMGLLEDSATSESPKFCALSNCSSMCDYNSTQCLCYDREDVLSNTTSEGDSKLYYVSIIDYVFTFLAIPVIIFFNVNLVSGPKQSVVFFYQCLPLVTTFAGKVLAYLVLQDQIYDNNLHIRDPMFMRFYIYQYLKYVIVTIEILLVLFLVKCSWCPLQKCRLPWAKTRRAVRNFREKHVPKHSVIHGICSVVLLAYGDLLAISSLIAVNLFQTCCYNTEGGCPQLCVDIDKLQEVVFGDVDVEHKLNVFKAFPTIVWLLLLPLPLSLIYYPTIPALFHKLTKRSLPRFPKLDPVFDVFQGVYKDKMRWFAGLHLLYRMILWLVFIGLSRNPNLQNFILLTLLIVILAIHSLFQPYLAHNHNYIETLFLLCLVLAAAFHQLVLYFQIQYREKPEITKTFQGLTAVLGVLPIIVIAGFNLYKCRHRLPFHPRLASCCKFSKSTHRMSRQSNMSDPHLYHHVWEAETLRRQEDPK